MRAPLFPSVKVSIAMLCVALLVLYATASAASVVDRLQHQGQSAHHHEHSAFSDLSFDDHHQPGDTSAQSPPAADGADSSHHHHHSDAPQGLAGSAVAYGALRGQPGAQRAAGSDDPIAGPGSPGPERPPKGLAFSL